MTDEEYVFEKRRLEKELKNRDMDIEELSDQIIDKEDKLKQLGKSNKFKSSPLTYF
jgi:hypothetical protein